MKIAVIGAGAMGSIYGGHLSEHNDVIMVDTSQEVVNQINYRGIVLQEKGENHTFRPEAVTSAEGIGPVELIMLFVKSLYSDNALERNRNLIGPDTYVMTLQNGSGHEDILGKFVPEERIIIGTTNDNGVLLGPGYIRHSGSGETCFGLSAGQENPFLLQLKKELDNCGFQATVSGDIRQMIWDKLFINVSLSVVTAILQVDMGFIAENEHAWKLAGRLIHEAVEVANRQGLGFDEEEIAREVRETSLKNPKGCTSIRADLRDGRRTEVDTISGAVVEAARRLGMDVPYHEMAVELVHSMENR